MTAFAEEMANEGRRAGGVGWRRADLSNVCGHPPAAGHAAGETAVFMHKCTQYLDREPGAEARLGSRSGRAEATVDLVPVDGIPPGGDVGGPEVLIFEIVSMLPH